LLIPQFKVSLTFVAILLTISMAAKAIGSFQPPNPALSGFIEGCEDKLQPCWYGIVPGVTTLEEATQPLKEYGLSKDLTFKEEDLLYDTIGGSILDDTTSSSILGRLKSKHCRFLLEFNPKDVTPVIEYVTLEECAGLELGQMMNAFGVPQGVQLPYGQSSFGFRIIFQSAVIDFTPPLNAFSHVTRIIIPWYPTDSRDTYFSWHGFPPRWRYCQLEPELYLCSANH
jgi:hypothetical protein